MIDNESWYPPESVVVLLMFFLCAVVILKSMTFCFRAMLLSCKEFQWFRDRPPSLFYKSASPDSKSPRLSHTSVKGRRALVYLLNSQDAERYTHNDFHAVLAPETRSCSICSALCRPLRTISDRQTLRVCS